MARRWNHNGCNCATRACPDATASSVCLGGSKVGRLYSNRSRPRVRNELTSCAAGSPAETRKTEPRHHEIVVHGSGRPMISASPVHLSKPFRGRRRQICRGRSGSAFARPETTCGGLRDPWSCAMRGYPQAAAPIGLPRRRGSRARGAVRRGGHDHNRRTLNLRPWIRFSAELAILASATFDSRMTPGRFERRLANRCTSGSRAAPCAAPPECGRRNRRKIPRPRPRTGAAGQA